MTNRAARIVTIGLPFRNKQGEMAVPRAFIHPCFKDGCGEYAAWGFGERFACRAHRNELSTLFDQARATQAGGTDGRSTGDRNLFGG